MKLITLDEHNTEVHRRLKTKLTGIQCGNCPEELQYVDDTVMCSYPAAQKDVKCFECGYTGRVYIHEYSQKGSTD